jgi:hypothetical protein
MFNLDMLTNFTNTRITMNLSTTNLLLFTLTVDTSAQMLETFYLRGLTPNLGKAFQSMIVKVCGAEIVNVLPTKRFILK